MIILSYVLANLTNHDFCMKNKENKCKGKYSYECNSDKCSIDKSACQYFNSLTFVLNLQRTNKVKDRKKFNEFKSAIKTCETHKNVWQTEDFCLNRMNCTVNEFDVIMRIWAFINQKCVCPKKHSFKCTHDVCSTDRYSCEHFKMNKNKSSTIKNILHCEKQT